TEHDAGAARHRLRRAAFRSACSPGSFLPVQPGEVVLIAVERDHPVTAPSRPDDLSHAAGSLRLLDAFLSREPKICLELRTPVLAQSGFGGRRGSGRSRLP